MSCYNIPNNLQLYFSNKSKISKEELIKVLIENPDILKNQTIMIFDLTDIEVKSSKTIQPGYLNTIDALEKGDQGNPIKSIFNPNKNLVAIFNFRNRLIETLKQREEEKGSPLNDLEKRNIEEDLKDDELKGEFVKKYFNPRYLHKIISAKSEKEIKSFLYLFFENLSPFCEINGELKYKSDLNPAIEEHKKKLEYSIPENIFKALCKNSNYFKDINNYEDDIKTLTNIYTEQFIKLNKYLKEDVSEKEVKWFNNRYLHSEIQSENLKIGSNIHFLRTVDNQDTDLFLFVSSNTKYKNWDSAKKQRYDYILGMTRAVLMSNGVENTPEKSLNLNIIPLIFKKGKIEDFEIQLDVPARNLETSNSGLEENGIITRELERFVNKDPNIIIPETNTDLETLHNTINKVTNGGWTSIIKHQRSKEELKQKILESKNPKGEYTFYKNIGTSSKKVIIKTESQIDEEIDKYLQELEKNKYQYTKDIIKTCNQVINARKHNKEIDINIFGSHNASVQTQVNKLFSNYLNGDYSIVARPEFYANGIIAFINNKTRHIDFITLTNEQLNLVHQLQEGGGTTIYGGYFKDDEAYKTFGKNIPSATTFSLEFLKVLTVCNAIPEIFEKCSIGNIYCTNINTGESRVADSNIHKHFSKLAQVIGNPNHLNSKILIQKSTNRWFFEINNLLNTLDSNDLQKEVKDQLDKLTTTNYYDYHILLKQVQELKKVIENKHREFKRQDITKDISFSTTEEKLYAMVCALEATYKRFQWENEEDFDSLNLNMPQFVQFFKMMFFNNVSRVSKDNVLLNGFAQGTTLSGANNMSSNMLKQIQEILDSGNLQIREQTEKECLKIQKSSIKLFKEKGISTAERWVVGDLYLTYNRLFEKDENGKIHRDFKVKNPWDMTNDLEKYEREYLIDILWQINKFRLSDLTEEERSGSFEAVKNHHKVQDAIANNTYFEIPLQRGNMLSRFHNRKSNGISDWFKQKSLFILDKFKEFSTTFDPRNLDRIHKDYFDRSKENYNKYPNIYKMDSITRNMVLDSEDVAYWETDLDFIAMNMAFHSAKEVIFNETLSSIRSIVTFAKFQSNITGQDISKYLQEIKDKIKITIFNEPLIEENLKQVANIIKTGRKITSNLTVGFKPLTLVKELSVGFIRNLSLATTNIIKSDKSFTLKEIKDAYLTIFGHIKTKSQDLISSDDRDIAEFTLINKLNNQYGMSNMDLNTIIDKLKTNRFGLSAGISKWSFWFATYGDFVNRMVLLIAEMKKNGSWDAHKIVNGELVYDMSKDKRFEIYYKHKNDQTFYNNPEFKKQKALYLTMMDEFIQEGYKNKDGKLLKYGDDLPRAYTTKQRNSIKELSDTMYGCYDHELKMKVEHTIYGLLFFQFKTYWSGAMRRYFAMPGTKTSKGKYVQAKDEQGNLLYRKPIYDEDGKIIIGWDTVTDNENGTLDELYIWEGDFMEGMMVSIVLTLKDSGYFILNKLGLTNQPVSFDRQRLANAALGIHDLLIGLFLYKILVWLFFGKLPEELNIKTMSEEESNLLTTLNVIGKASNEFSLDSTLLLTSFTPSFVLTNQRVANKFLDTLFEDDYDLKQFVIDNVSGIKDFAKVQIIS